MTPQIRQILLLLALGTQSNMAQTFFSPSQDYPIPNPSRPAFADFNGDGRTDMAALSVVETITGPGGSTTEIFLYFYAGQNSSTSQFAQPTVMATPVFVTYFNSRISGQLYAGDFDNDKKQDLLAFGENGFYFLKGNGNGTFQIPLFGTTGAAQSYAIIRDFNNDEKLDMMYGGAGIIRFGNGNGTFTGPTTLFPSSCVDSTENSTRRTHLADLNRDGLADAINECAGTGVAVAYRNPDGSFGSPVTVSSFPGRAVIDDFNSDGINDLLVIQPNQKTIRYGASNGTLLPEASATVPATIAADGKVWSALSADLNFDGVKDLLVSDDQSFKVLVGTTPGLFTEALNRQIGAYDATRNGYLLEFVDINRDGGPDFYTQSLVSDKITLYFSQPPSVFLSTSLNPAAPGVPITLTALIASPATGVAFTNQGQVTFYSGSNPIGAAVAVINGTANFTTSSLPQGIHYITAAFQATPSSPVITSKLVTVVVTTSACAASAASFTASGFRFDRNTNQFIQDIDITNRTALAIPGPVSVMVAGLSSNASLASPYAITTCNSPGTPVVDAGICPNGVLAPNQTVRVTLRFNNPSRAAITYTPQTLAGLGRR